MQVVKLGPIIDNVWPREVNCRRCRSTLALEPLDIEAHYDQRDGENAKFTCVVCGELNYADIKLYNEAKLYLQVQRRKGM